MTTTVLIEIGDNRAEETIIKVLNDEDGPISSHAAEALGTIGDNRAVEPLIGELNDSDEYIREKAADALRHLYKVAG